MVVLRIVGELSAAADVPQVPLRERYMAITAIILLDPILLHICFLPSDMRHN